MVCDSCREQACSLGAGNTSDAITDAGCGEKGRAGSTGLPVFQTRDLESPFQGGAGEPLEADRRGDNNV